jgi:hypothetical protein
VRQEKLAFLVVDAAGAATAAFYHPNVHNATADCGGQDWPRETDLKTPRIIRILIVIGSQDLLGFLLRIRMTMPPADTCDFCGDVTGEVSPDFVMDLPFVYGVAGAEVTNLRQKQAFLVAALATRYTAFITGGFIDCDLDSDPIEDLAVCTIGCRTAGVCQDGADGIDVAFAVAQTDIHRVSALLHSLVVSCTERLQEIDRNGVAHDEFVAFAIQRHSAKYANLGAWFFFAMLFVESIELLARFSNLRVNIRRRIGLTLPLEQLFPGVKKLLFLLLIVGFAFLRWRDGFDKQAADDSVSV